MLRRRVLGAALALLAAALLSLAACSKPANSGAGGLAAGGTSPAGTPTGRPQPPATITATAATTATVTATTKSSKPTATKTTKKSTPKPSISGNAFSPVPAFNDKLDALTDLMCAAAAGGPGNNDIVAGALFKIEETDGNGPSTLPVQFENSQTSAHDQHAEPLNTQFLLTQDVGSIASYAGKTVWFTVYIAPDGDDDPYDNSWKLGIAIPSTFNSSYGLGAYPCKLPLS